MADLTPQTWAATLLKRLGIHQTPGAVQALTGWAKAEGGNWANDAKYNPLNTTQDAPGAGNTGTQGNIKSYKSWDQGLEATVKTLKNGRYGGILHALAAGDPNAVASAIGQTPWGTGGGLVQKTIASTPRVAGIHAVSDLAGGATRVGGGATASPGGAAAATTTQETTPSSGDPADVAGFLQQLLAKQQPAPMQTTALTTPAIAAAPPVAAGYQAPASGGGVQAAAQPDLTQVAAALASTVTPQQTTSTTSSSGGGNAAPADVSAAGNALVQSAVQNANLIDSKHLPYLWGGGHGGKVNPKNTGPLDCSGAVSAVLGIDPRVSGDFEKFGSAGRSKDGKGINIYANSGHVLMEIDGHFFGTSKSNPGGGAGWIPRSQLSGSYLKNFTVRHLAATSG